jgi:DHA2 family multidrug resistance protein
MATAPLAPASAAHPVPTHKWLVALAVMLGTALEVLDTSIVNVALPHMQGAFSASVDEIAWVLTSYLVANGIMIPMTAWISSRFGRKRYFLTSVFAFVAASALCGAAQSLTQIITFRMIQGAAGAAMIPSSQAILMETFPPEEQQMAMALWGMGLMVAPIIGPTLGGLDHRQLELALEFLHQSARGFRRIRDGFRLCPRSAVPAPNPRAKGPS